MSKKPTPLKIVRPYPPDRLIARLKQTLLSEVLRKNKHPKVVDIGCGYGHWVNALHHLGCDVLGVDIEPEYIASARHTYPHCKFLVADGLKLDLTGFDVVLCRGGSFYNRPMIENGKVTEEKIFATQRLIKLGYPGALLLVCYPSTCSWGETPEWNDRHSWFSNTPDCLKAVLSLFGKPKMSIIDNVMNDPKVIEIWGQLWIPSMEKVTKPQVPPGVHISQKAYINFLNTIRKHFDIAPLKDYSLKSERTVCLLRHDVDEGRGIGLQGAYQQAKIEHDLGICSSYYVLPTASYYKRTRTFLALCKAIQDRGHEIGYHNDVLTICIDEKRIPDDVLSEHLFFLRINGLKIHGMTSHGHGEYRKKYSVLSNQIFKDHVPTKKKYQKTHVENIELYTIDLEEYGLYDGDHIPRDRYISDNGGRWNFSITQELNGLPPITLDEYLASIADKVKQIVLLTHPEVWCSPRYASFREEFEDK